MKRIASLARPRNGGWFARIVLGTLAALCAAVLPGLTRAASAAEEIVVYTALEDDQIPRYMTSFTERHPDIKVKFVRDSTGIVTAKLLAEKDKPVADVVWGLAATSLLLLEQQGLLEPYAPKGLERIEAPYRDADATPSWVGIDAWMTGFCVNTVESQAKKLPMPKSFADLVKPEYKGMLVMPNPASSGTGFLTVSAILQIMGEEKGWQYLDKLHENMAVYTHSGSKPCKMAGAGEFPVGISFGYRGIIQKQKGEPVETVFPTEGSGWDVEANGLIRKAAIKPAARVFLDWAISETVMKEYGKSFAITAAPTGEPVPQGYPANPKAQLAKNDLGWAAKNRDRILAEWTRRYDGKSEAKK